MPVFQEVIKGNGHSEDVEESARAVVFTEPEGELGIEHIGNPTNDGEASLGRPFTVLVTIQGSAELLFHRYSVEAVAEKGAAPKGSEAKKTDDIESYIYRNEEDQICLPGRYLQRSMVGAARNHQDPRSPRKMAVDLIKASLLVTPNYAPILVDGKPVTKWDYLDRQRVTVNRAAISRSRPAFKEGWQAKLELKSLQPAYLTRQLMRSLINDAGQFVGLADFRPTYGRFDIVSWEVVS